MQQYGTATVIGVDGTVAYEDEAAIAGFADSVETEHRVTVEDFMDSFGELLGFRKSDERIVLMLTIIPKVAAAAGSLQKTLAALKFPAVPSKVTFVTTQDLTDAIGGAAGQAPAAKGELYGDPSASPKGNEYIYTGGARRTHVRGQGALQLVVWRSKSSSLTVAQLLAVAS